MYRQRVTYWLCLSVLLLAACDNGGVQLDSLQAGIEGSGHRITTSGVMRATASGIVVNGVEYGLDGAAITVNGVPAFSSELESGLLAIVQGQLDPGGQTGSALQVDVEIALAGRIESLDVAVNRFAVLGQVVEVDESTIVEDEVEGSPLRGLALGRDVEVSGFADSSGVLHASLIANRRASMPFVVTGHIASVDANAHLFLIDGQAVSYESATLSSLIVPVVGITVQVAARDLRQDVLIADTVSLRTSYLPGIVGDEAAIEGRVTRLSSLSDFEIDGRAVAQGPGAPSQDASVLLDAFVAARGRLSGAGVVVASAVRTVLPAGRVVGYVTIDGKQYELSGVVTPSQDFRLSIGQVTGGPPETEPSFGQLVGSFSLGSNAVGNAVLIGEDCAGPAPKRFCGRRFPVRFDVIPPGGAGTFRVTTDLGEVSWPVTLGYWGGRSGFDPTMTVAKTYELAQTEMVSGASVMLTVDDAGRLFFQNPLNSCTGNGTIGQLIAGVELRHVRLTITGCNAAFAYLNGHFEGLGLIESYTPWDYDSSILRLWISTLADAPSAAAISLWGQDINFP